MKCSAFLAGILTASTAVAQINPDPVWIADPAIGQAFFDVSSDGNLLALYPESKSHVAIVDLESGSILSELEMKPFEASTNWFRALPLNDGIRFSADDRFFAANTQGETRLWSSEEHEILLNLQVEGSGTCTFTPDSKMFISTDGITVVFWDLETMAERYRWSMNSDATGIASISTSRDGNLLALATGYSTIAPEKARATVHEASSGDLIQHVRWDLVGLTSMAFTPDNSSLFITESGYWSQWSLDPPSTRPELLAQAGFRGAIRIQIDPEFEYTLQIGILGFVPNSIATAESSRAFIYEETDNDFEGSSFAIFTDDGNGFFLWRQASPTIFGLFKGKVPVKFRTPTINDGELSLQWIGRGGPFQVQQKTALSDKWIDLGEPTLEREFAIPANAATGFFRLVDVE